MVNCVKKWIDYRRISIVIKLSMNVLAWCHLSSRGDCRSSFRVHKTHTHTKNENKKMN
jgi:hypothetical protein